MRAAERVPEAGPAFTLELGAAPGTPASRLIDCSGLRRERVGQLRRPTASRRAQLQVNSGDLALIGVTLLYGLGRLKAEQHLQILGGFVRQDAH